MHKWQFVGLSYLVCFYCLVILIDELYLVSAIHLIWEVHCDQVNRGKLTL